MYGPIQLGGAVAASDINDSRRTDIGEPVMPGTACCETF
jgi:hypothetical protein